MNSKFSEYTDEDHKMHNGQTVISVLSYLGNAATSDRICDEISYLSSQTKETVEPEVKRILRRGISNGFLVKFGKHYLLSSENTTVEVDSKRKSYETIGKRNKRQRSMKSVNNISDRSDGNYLRVTKNLSLKQDETDDDEKNKQLVLLNPKEVVNGIIKDLYKLVNPAEETSDEQDEQDNVIDLEAILSKNLNTLSKPLDDLMAME
ncbi:hypothetical protein HA402_005702 [Bradysia odoriphaga]|nr:hypothetical protein HA402_005702 [Bradysia odoriphaga]